MDNENKEGTTEKKENSRINPHFIDELAAKKTLVEIYSIMGGKVKGRIYKFNLYEIMIKTEDKQDIIIFKSNIFYIVRCEK